MASPSIHLRGLALLSQQKNMVMAAILEGKLYGELPSNMAAVTMV